jgi:hypothetical protein
MVESGVLRRLLFVLFLVLLPSLLYAQQATTVRREIDGDTLKISYKGQRESIRLIGIDTTMPTVKCDNCAHSVSNCWTCLVDCDEASFWQGLIEGFTNL